MTIEEAVRARLLSLGPVAAVAGARVYNELPPQKPTQPFIVVYCIDEQADMHLKGPVGVPKSRVQVDSIASTKATVETLDAAVHGNGLGDAATGLNGFTGTAGSVRVTSILPVNVRKDYTAGELKQFLVSREYMVAFRQP